MLKDNTIYKGDDKIQGTYTFFGVMIWIYYLLAQTENFLLW